MSDELQHVTLPPKEACIQHRKVLIIQAPYFTLTCRVDPNVVFWGPGRAGIGVPIPSDVTHLWIADFVSQPIREDLLRQTAEPGRSVVLWNCAVGELIHRLQSFWGDPSNRSPLQPVQPDERERPEGDFPDLKVFGEEDHLGFRGLDRSTIDQVADRAHGEESSEVDSLPDEEVADHSGSVRVRSAVRKRFLTRRLKLLKAAHARVKARVNGETSVLRVEAPALQKPIAKKGISADQLRGLAEFDRLVFLFYSGDNGGPCRPLTDVAKEFGFPEANVRRLVERVQNTISMQ